MNKNSTKLKITVQVPPEIIDALRKSAQENQRSFNGELVWALQKYLEKTRREKQ